MSKAETGDEALYSNPFREALSVKRPLRGLWLMLNSANAAEGLGWSGFDWLLIDGEHSPVSLGEAIHHMRAIETTPAVPLVRVAENNPVLLKRYLDAGARTIMVPYVQSPDAARAAVAAIQYPGAGIRGFAGMHRASRFGHMKEYVHRASEGLYLIVQVETGEAMDRLDEIADVPGVDAVFFGPGDLSASLGRLGRMDDPEVTEMIIAAREKVAATGKDAGVLAPSPATARRYLDAGFDFVSVGSDCGLLFGGARALAAEFPQEETR
ncbi:HpcH/HpaI aldolase/citrate lyase family protein [Aurantimonas sp. VKM B-3413]|uniref:HpcH/HpaI aldolase family protein n=1 Tax=Aurantimonas sp. VKM B-3413 TaxID=2779401 RepID=UPI001E3D509C|nr:aldolase/citrate lyase family protein [Aurantimonas sp. VKM B-3413]MCB8840482.1 hypothetical protein [Aurantimonas sp. VKM B-3413]